MCYDKSKQVEKEEKMKKKQLKKFHIRRIVAVLVIIGLILGIRNLVYHSWYKSQSKEVRLLLDNELVKDLSPIYRQDSGIYISKEDIQKIFDDTIYYNVGDEELITTYNKHVAVLHLNDGTMMLNDAIVSMQGKLQEIDSKIYLPISDLGIVYDVEVEYAEATNRVILNSTTKAKKQAMVLKDTKIKSSQFPFAVTIEKVKRGDNLFILQENAHSSKVRTASRKYWIFV